MLYIIQVKAVITFDQMLCVLSMAEECDAVHNSSHCGGSI